MIFDSYVVTEPEVVWALLFAKYTYTASEILLNSLDIITSVRLSLYVVGLREYTPFGLWSSIRVRHHDQRPSEISRLVERSISCAFCVLGCYRCLHLECSLVCLGGLGGCDSKPADGTVIQDSGTASEEEQSKIDRHYKDRKQNAKKKQLTPKR